jgi:dTDP-4-dehydrorhamnose reductase
MLTMSIMETSPLGLELPDDYQELSSSQITERMVAVAPPGQTSLDPRTLHELSLLTTRLVQVNYSDSTAEHDRYLAVEKRELELDVEKLAQYISGKSILITGGTGLIGSELIKKILPLDPKRVVSISRGLKQPYSVATDVEYMTADIRDADRMQSIIQSVKPEIIFHVAADKYNHEAESRAHHTLTTNVSGTKNIVAAAAAVGVGQIVYASTGKATRPYSPDIYASSKKTGEWLMSKTAHDTDILCTAVRFTHVVNDSNLVRKVNNNIDTGSPVGIQSPNNWMYVQSAGESAQLLLNATLEAQPNVLKIQAIRDLEMPINLAMFGIGAIAKRKANVPIYFQGATEGYEDKAWPHLYGIESGDYSPLISALEVSQTSSSEVCQQVDTFPLEIEETEELTRKFDSLLFALDHNADPQVLRDINQSFSWDLLAARLVKVPEQSLRNIHQQIIRQDEGYSEEHNLVNEAVMHELSSRENSIQ